MPKKMTEEIKGNKFFQKCRTRPKPEGTCGKCIYEGPCEENKKLNKN
jgi:hypothetical protein